MKYILVALFLTLSVSAIAEVHINKKVDAVQVANNTQCIYFSLEGVIQADAIVPNERWFTVAADSPVKEEVLSVVLLAYASGESIRVSTSGNAVCGFAEVHYVRLTK